MSKQWTADLVLLLTVCDWLQSFCLVSPQWFIEIWTRISLSHPEDRCLWHRASSNVQSTVVIWGRNVWGTDVDVLLREKDRAYFSKERINVRAKIPPREIVLVQFCAETVESFKYFQMFVTSDRGALQFRVPVRRLRGSRYGGHTFFVAPSQRFSTLFH